MPDQTGSYDPVIHNTYTNVCIVKNGKCESTVSRRMTHRGVRCILDTDISSLCAFCLQNSKRCNVLTALLQSGGVSYTEGLAVRVDLVVVVMMVEVDVVVAVVVLVLKVVVVAVAVFVVVVVAFVVVVVAFVVDVVFVVVLKRVAFAAVVFALVAVVVVAFVAVVVAIVFLVVAFVLAVVVVAVLVPAVVVVVVVDVVAVEPVLSFWSSNKIVVQAREDRFLPNLG